MSAAHSVKIHNLEKRVEQLESDLVNLTKLVEAKPAEKPAPAKKVSKKAK